MPILYGTSLASWRKRFEGDAMKPAPFSSLADDGASTAASNRRVFPRIPAAQVPQLSATLTTGPDIRLIDVSRGGALFECTKRLVPASAVALRLVTPDGTHIVRGRVVRSRIVRLERGGLGYQAAVAFNEPLKALIDDAEAPPPAQSTPAPDAPALSAPSAASAAASGAEPASTAPVEDASAESDTAEQWTVPIMTLTANVLHTSAELHEIFNGNDW
jgi:hypothetical protein